MKDEVFYDLNTTTQARTQTFFIGGCGGGGCLGSDLGALYILSFVLKTVL